MTRILLTIIGALVVVISQLEGVRAQEIAGVYRSEGLNPDGSQYLGLVEIKLNGAVYELKWVSNVMGQQFGHGILRDGRLAVSYYSHSHTGVVSPGGVIIYIVEGEKLVGKWTTHWKKHNEPYQVYSETLTKLPGVLELPKESPESAPQQKRKLYGASA